MNLTIMLVMTTIVIGKVEGLPTTSNTKMIDMWLILCQLVPFAQVVFLTIKEYLREDEKVSLENDDIQPTTPDITLEDESNPKEARMSSLKELLKAGSITMLTMIGGKILTKFKILFSGSLFREKVVPLIALFATTVYFAIAASFYFE